MCAYISSAFSHFKLVIQLKPMLQLITQTAVRYSQEIHNLRFTQPYIMDGYNSLTERWNTTCGRSPRTLFRNSGRGQPLLRTHHHAVSCDGVCGPWKTLLKYPRSSAAAAAAVVWLLVLSYVRLWWVMFLRCQRCREMLCIKFARKAHLLTD